MISKVIDINTKNRKRRKCTQQTMQTLVRRSQTARCVCAARLFWQQEITLYFILYTFAGKNNYASIEAFD